MLTYHTNDRCLLSSSLKIQIWHIGTKTKKTWRDAPPPPHTPHPRKTNNTSPPKHTHTQTPTTANTDKLSANRQCVHLCVCVCGARAYVCMYACVCVCYECACVRVCVHVYVCVRTCIAKNDIKVPLPTHPPTPYPWRRPRLQYWGLFN